MSSQRLALFEWIDQIYSQAFADYSASVATELVSRGAMQYCNEKLKLRWPPKQKKVKLSEVYVIEKGKPALPLREWQSAYIRHVKHEHDKALRHLTKVFPPQVKIRSEDNELPFNADLQKWIDTRQTLLAGTYFVEVKLVGNGYILMSIDSLEHVLGLQELRHMT